MNVSVFIATSLDGFIARENGDVDWLPSGEELSDSSKIDEYGYEKFIKDINVLVMGKNSFEKVLTFGDWPYKDLQVIVLCKSLKNLPNHIPNTVSISSAEPKQLIYELETKGIKNIYIDGGKVIQSFLKENLVSKLILTRVPIILGKGISLFGYLNQEVKLNHISTYSGSFGMVQSEYEVIK